MPHQSSPQAQRFSALNATESFLLGSKKRAVQKASNNHSPSRVKRAAQIEVKGTK
jgi:hypothetical protein